VKRPLPRLAERLLSRLIHDRIARDGLLGDLEERYTALAAAGPLRRWGWLAIELAAAVFHYAGPRAPRIHLGRGESNTMDALGQDLRFAARDLIRRPAFSLLVIVTLGVAIGANTAVFSVVKGLLLEPLPFEASERLVIINQIGDEGFTGSVSFPNYRDWKERNRTFDPFATVLPGSTPLTTASGTRMLESAWVHGGFFEVFGVEAAVGRTLTAVETEPGGPPVAVLSHALWQTDFGADPSVVGSDVVLRGEPFTVVGVMPADFTVYPDTDVYLPLGYVVDLVPWEDRGTGAGAEVFARLAPNATFDEARTDLDAIARDLRAEFGDDASRANAVLLRDWYLGDAPRQLLLMMAAVVLVLLVACANVANLLFVRGETRRGEIAVRAALGAGRGRVYRQLLTESAVYGVLGGLLGVAVGRLGLDALLGVLGDTFPAGSAARIGVDSGVLAFTGATAVLTVVLAGLVPAWRTSRARLSEALRDSGTAVRRTGRARDVLVGAEVALSMVLLVSAGLVIASLHNLQQVDKGFTGSGIVTLRVSATGEGYDSRESWAGFHQQLRDRVRALPGVITASSSNHFPLSGNSWEMLFRDRDTPAGERGSSVLLTMVSPEYFDAYSVDIIEGRGFTEADRWDAEHVAIVDETLAAARWPGESPIGKMVTFEQLPNEAGDYVIDVWRRVVGVAHHVRHYELARPSRIEVYTPLAQSAAWGFTSYLSVRSGSDPAALVPAIRRVVAELDPEVALYRIRTMDEVLDQEFGAYRALRQLLGMLAALTLVLGGVGIYSVVSHAATLRVREVGVRLVLGGAPGAVVRLIVRDSLVPAVAGLVAGTFGAMAAARLLGSMLFEVGPADPAVLGASALMLAAVAGAAAWLPARRAARVQPTRALRAN
jgi:putative ABC transport system permease protein